MKGEEGPLKIVVTFVTFIQNTGEDIKDYSFFKMWIVNNLLKILEIIVIYCTSQRWQKKEGTFKGMKYELISMIFWP